MDPESLSAAAELIGHAERIVALTGAGISAESGVPTFRGPEGLWRGFEPQALATPDAFSRDPELVWEWYGWRRQRVLGCSPNDAHRALAEFTPSASLSIITQNVDGLHRVAGAGMASPPELIELHGALFASRCTVCGEIVEDRTIPRPSEEEVPSCSTCGGLLRPDVVWFGEQLDPARLERAFDLASAADVCLVVGTSGVVQPAAGVAEATRAAGGALIEINPQSTPITPRCTVAIASPAAAALPALLAASGRAAAVQAPADGRST